MVIPNTLEDTEINILLIEDNEGDAKLIQHQLVNVERMNYQITHCENLTSSLQKLSGNTFDIVLTDLSLPDAEGLEVIEQIIQNYPKIPIVVISGHEDQEVSLKAVQCGAQDYLIKGIGDGHLISRSIRYAVERKRTEQKMIHLAHYDSLTGLANRALFRERLEHAINRAQRNQKQIAILFIDLDRFKQINDTLGHDTGDALLINVSIRIQDCIRKQDTVARLGGDEFVVILEDLHDMKDAAMVAQKIISELSQPCKVFDQDLYITPSIGITLYPTDDMDTNELLKNADTAMYLAKEKGRNRFQFYTDDMNKESKQRLDIETKLRKALQNDEFFLLFQPKFEINSLTTIGAETLIRWQHPEMGMVSPMDFIPIAEETGLIVPIGEWVIQQSCRYLQTWKEQGYKPIKMAVNLSPRQFHQSEIVDFILDTLVSHNIKPSEFEVEITESLLMEDTDTTINLLNKLKAWGVSISVDDFGTGYCSLGYLKKFPIDTLKIDRSFVKDIMTEPDDAAITEAIIAMAHSLRLNVIAEGVETEDQLKFLKQFGCNEGQGYYYSRPLPAELFEDFLVPMERRQIIQSKEPIPIKRSA